GYTRGHKDRRNKAGDGEGAGSFESPVNRCSPNAQATSDLGWPDAFGSQAAHGRNVHGRLPALVNASRLSFGDPLHLSLTTEVRLELGEGREHVEHEPAV